jgi:hypothetical protein
MHEVAKHLLTVSCCLLRFFSFFCFSEGHQVFNTQNQLTWHREVLRWVGEWTNTPIVGAEAEADASDEL